MPIPSLTLEMLSATVLSVGIQIASTLEAKPATFVLISSLSVHVSLMTSKPSVSATVSAKSAYLVASGIIFLVNLI